MSSSKRLLYGTVLSASPLAMTMTYLNESNGPRFLLAPLQCTLLITPYGRYVIVLILHRRKPRLRHTVPAQLEKQS